MTRQKEIDAMRNDPKIIAGIREGLYAAHLGHVFPHKQVFGALEGTNDNRLSRWYYRSIINLKEFWWLLKAPWQRYISHRNCPQCRSYRDKDRCIFCDSKEEVSLCPVDTPSNLQPVCIDCWESFQDACRSAEVEEG